MVEMSVGQQDRIQVSQVVPQRRTIQRLDIPPSLE